MQITKQKDGSYIITPISQATSTMLDQIYSAYREWLKDAFPPLNCVIYKDKVENRGNGYCDEDNQDC